MAPASGQRGRALSPSHDALQPKSCPPFAQRQISTSRPQLAQLPGTETDTVGRDAYTKPVNWAADISLRPGGSGLALAPSQGEAQQQETVQDRSRGDENGMHAVHPWFSNAQETGLHNPPIDVSASTDEGRAEAS